MLDAILRSKFYSKCKSEIKLTKRRIEIIKRKRNAMQKFLRNDVADLLKNGLDSNAYGRVEQLYTDQHLSSCYEFVEESCFLILSHLSSMDKQRECPEECKEAISTLMFAAARFADLPELRELRSLFADRYGNYLEPYVNKEFVQKLKAESPSKEIKIEMMQEIAVESGIEWDYKALELKLYKPPPFVKESAERNKTQNKKQDLEINVKATEEVGKKGNGSRGVEPYWSSNSSSSSKSTTSPEYSTDSSASEDGPAEGRNFYTLRSMCPPYRKTEADNLQTASEEKKSYGLRSMAAPPYIKRDNPKHEESSSDSNTKPVPRSMRVRRPLKPVAGSHGHNEISKPASKNSNGDDEEEKKREKLSWNNGREVAGPTRVTSLPTEREEKKEFGRAATIQGDSGHVHPKLPDYEDFVARLAAFRATS